MASSRYRAVLIRDTGNRGYLVIDPSLDSVYGVGLGFPTYSTDLVLSTDSLDEYNLIKHLSVDQVFNYFISKT